MRVTILGQCLVIPIEFEIKLRYVCDHFGTMSLENAVSIDPKSSECLVIILGALIAFVFCRTWNNNFVNSRVLSEGQEWWQMQTVSE